MNRIVVVFLTLFFIVLLLSSPVFAGITQKTVTVSVPKDYRSVEAYKVEFVVPDGSAAFNFTLWGDEKPWGIVDISNGGYREVYSSKSNGPGDDAPLNDAESSERIGGPPVETGPDNSLSTLTLKSGTYLIWTEGGPGTSITLQYLLQTSR